MNILGRTGNLLKVVEKARDLHEDPEKNGTFTEVLGKPVPFPRPS